MEKLKNDLQLAYCQYLSLRDSGVDSFSGLVRKQYYISILRIRVNKILRKIQNKFFD